MTNKELKALLKILRSTGAVSYEANGIKLLLDPNFSTETLHKRIKSSIPGLGISAGIAQNLISPSLPDLSEDEWLMATNNIDPEVEPSDA